MFFVADRKSLTIGILVTVLCLVAGLIMYLKRKTLIKLLFTSKKTTMEKLRYDNYTYFHFNKYWYKMITVTPLIPYVHYLCSLWQASKYDGTARVRFIKSISIKMGMSVFFLVQLNFTDGSVNRVGFD